MTALATERDYFIYNLKNMDFENKADEFFEELNK